MAQANDNYDDLIREWLERASADELEQRINVRSGFLLELMSDDDWSFGIKAHAFAEAAVTHLLVDQLGDSRLYDVLARIEMSNATTGKLAFASALELLGKDSRRFVQKLSELRNQFVHDVVNTSVDLPTYFGQLNEGERKGLHKAFGWGWQRLADIRISDPDDPAALYYVPAVGALEKHPKLAIWLALLCFLREISRREERIRNAKQPNRVGGGFSPPPPTPPSMRVRTGRFTADEQARPRGL